jgi:hypothetical protein
MDFRHESPPRTRRSRLRCLYAAFFAARIFAHLARSVAAIFLRADADIVRFAGAKLAVLIAPTAGCDPFRILAHRAFCASAIFRRDAAEITRPGCDDLCNTLAPVKDSIPEII